MLGRLLCLLGFHDWSGFGDCERDRMHVQHRPDDWVYGGPHPRAAALRRAHWVREGRFLQEELRQRWGEEVSDMVCQDAVANGWADALRATVAAKAARRAESARRYVEERV